MPHADGQSAVESCIGDRFTGMLDRDISEKSDFSTSLTIDPSARSNSMIHRVNLLIPDDLPKIAECRIVLLDLANAQQSTLHLHRNAELWSMNWDNLHEPRYV
jgi:hypothetical protein